MVNLIAQQDEDTLVIHAIIDDIRQDIEDATHPEVITEDDTIELQTSR